jgi:hypothetical protein
LIFETWSLWSIYKHLIKLQVIGRSFVIQVVCQSGNCGFIFSYWDGKGLKILKFKSSTVCSHGFGTEKGNRSPILSNLHQHCLHSSDTIISLNAYSLRQTSSNFFLSFPLFLIIYAFVFQSIKVHQNVHASHIYTATTTAYKKEIGLWKSSPNKRFWIVGKFVKKTVEKNAQVKFDCREGK